MKNIQRKLSLLFVCLLVVSESLHGSWSWWQSIIKAPLQSLTESESVKKLLLLAFFATFVGFVYWMSKKPKDIERNKDIASIDISYELKQYPVYSQFEPNGGGSASCGYHALFRSLQLVQSKNNKESEEQLETTFMSPELISAYFGSSGDWRKKIIMNRKKNMLQNDLSAQFSSIVAKDKKEKNTELYKSALNDFAKIIVSCLEDDTQGTKEYSVNEEDIQHYIAESLEKLKNAQNGVLIEELKTPQMMHEYINIFDMRAKVFSEFPRVRPIDLLKKAINKPDPDNRLKGDWLDDGEIELLWKYEKDKQNSLIPKNVICELKTVANPSLIGEEQDEVTPFIKANIVNYWDTKKPLFFVFVLGSMKQIDNFTGTSEHWYSLDMYQNKEKKRFYSIMDSDPSKNRMQDATALKVIKTIEFEIAQRLKD